MGQDDPKIDPGIYAARYRAARAYARKSRLEVATALGVHEVTIRRRELGQGGEGPRPPERHALAMFCGVPVEFIEYGFEAADWTEAQRIAVRNLGAAAAAATAQQPVVHEEREREGQRDSPPAPGDPDSPEVPEADAL